MANYRWLTESSKLYLERDYLLKGQTVDERVDIICNAAEKLLDKPGFAKAFKENFQKGWYSFSTPIWANFGTDRGLPISCVVGETWINTKVNGGKQAKDICVGDEVLTHKGRYRKVTNIIKTENRSGIFKLKINTRMTNLYLTGDHLVLTNLGWVRVDQLDVKKHLVAANRLMEFDEIPYSIDLTKNCNYDFIIKENKIYKKGSDAVRKDRKVEIVSYYASPFCEIPLDKEVAWALGLWFAEGSLSTDGEKPNGARVTVNAEDEKEFGDKWLQIMKDKFGINGGAYESEVIRDNKLNHWYSINVNSLVIGNFFSQFGSCCKDKTIPQWIINSPKEILYEFLKGLLKGDGTIRLDGSVKITLSNPQLILQVYQIALKLNLDVSLQMQDKAAKFSTTSHVYTVRFRSPKISTGQFTGNAAIAFNDGLYYCPIRILEKTNKIETVYDFTVEEDHSFSAAGVLLHNCFGSHIDDNMESILFTQAEVGMMTKTGGGTSAYFGDVRERGAKIRDNGESSGSVHFMRLFENIIKIISQGCTRRGNFAAYLPIDHKDILEFLNIRRDGFPIQDISFGVCVPDYWMQEMIDGDWDKRKVWAKVLEDRANSGFPFIFFTDTANNNTVDVYKDKGLKIRHTNLCTEIFLPDATDESFVCDLSSMNIIYYDEWKDTNAIELLVYFLDAVMTEFINKAKEYEFMERSVKFAERHRALGIGWIGWHSYLQSKMIPFESMEAKLLTSAIARNMKEAAYKASAKLAEEYGEPELLVGYGRRNSTLLAIAPTKSSAFIIGQASENTEPNNTNYYIKDLQKGKFTIRNTYLEVLLESKGYNNEETWNSILKNGGSVQYLSFLSQHEKDVFKTFAEISPKEIVIQASIRQKYIDQGQSINLMIHPSIPIKDVNALMIEAWKLGLKSLYYQLSVNAAQAFSRNVLTCVSCEG